MKLGMQIGLGPGHIVLDGDQTTHSLTHGDQAPPPFICDIAIFVLKRDVKLQPTNQPAPPLPKGHSPSIFGLES